MIEVRYRMRFGNNLFQYCFGRILAEELGYELAADPLPGFPNTSHHVSGNRYLKPTVRLTGHVTDLSEILSDRSKRHIILDGYFQRYEHYRNYKSRIRNDWLITNLSSYPINTKDVVLCVRRGDYVPLHALPFSYYHDAIRLLHPRRVYICSDEPHDPFVKLLVWRYRAELIPPDPMQNLEFIKSFRKIVISNSTFCWWAAFLSHGTEIIAPIPVQGFWGPNYKNSLRVYDEPRYRYIQCKEVYHPNVLERAIWSYRNLKAYARDTIIQRQANL